MSLRSVSLNPSVGGGRDGPFFCFSSGDPTALALAPDVDWTEEKACFRTVADALATFYADSFDSSPETAREAIDAETKETEAETLETEENLTRVRAIKQYVFPAMRRCLYPSKVAAVQGVATQVASLEQLYRVFERC